MPPMMGQHKHIMVPPPPMHGHLLQECHLSMQMRRITNNTTTKQQQQPQANFLTEEEFKEKAKRATIAGKEICRKKKVWFLWKHKRKKCLQNI